LSHLRLLFELYEIWSVDSQENCGGEAGRLNSGRLEHTPKSLPLDPTETVWDLMEEVRARCIEALSATTSSMEGGTLQRLQTTVMKK